MSPQRGYTRWRGSGRKERVTSCETAYQMAAYASRKSSPKRDSGSRIPRLRLRRLPRAAWRTRRTKAGSLSRRKASASAEIGGRGEAGGEEAGMEGESNGRGGKIRDIRVPAYQQWQRKASPGAAYGRARRTQETASGFFTVPLRRLCTMGLLRVCNAVGRRFVASAQRHWRMGKKPSTLVR